VDLDLDVDLDVDGIRGAPLSLSNSITCTATTSKSTSNSRSRSKSRSQNRDSHAKMESLKNYAALGWQPAPTFHAPLGAPAAHEGPFRKLMPTCAYLPSASMNANVIAD
jgi:hypothetical protein